MEWLLAALAVIILGLAALAAAGHLGSLPAPSDDVYRPTLPEGDLTPQTLRATRFGVAIRGYDMAQVDALLERLADQLERSGEPVQAVVDEADPAPLGGPAFGAGATAEPPSVPATARDAE